jgi:hypothetical protein
MHWLAVTSGKETRSQLAHSFHDTSFSTYSHSSSRKRIITSDLRHPKLLRSTKHKSGVRKIKNNEMLLYGQIPQLLLTLDRSEGYLHSVRRLYAKQMACYD